MQTSRPQSTTFKIYYEICSQRKIHFFIFSLLQFSVKNKEDILLDRIKMTKNRLEFDQKKLTGQTITLEHDQKFTPTNVKVRT